MFDDADPRVGYAWVPKTKEHDEEYLLRQLWAPTRMGAAYTLAHNLRARMLSYVLFGWFYESWVLVEAVFEGSEVNGLWMAAGSGGGCLCEAAEIFSRETVYDRAGAGKGGQDPAVMAEVADAMLRAAAVSMYSPRMVRKHKAAAESVGELREPAAVPTN